jgi:hypothetical protein
VGRFTLSGTRQWHDIAFGEPFDGNPHLFLTHQSLNDGLGEQSVGWLPGYLKP